MSRRALIGTGVVVALLGLVLLVMNLGGDGPPGEAGTATTGTGAAATSDAPTRHDEASAAPSVDQRTVTQAPRPESAAEADWLPPADAEPVSVRVDAAGIDHGLVPQGLAADGTINPAQDEVIWFTGYDRVSPGQVGTSVIAGHVTYGDAPDAFFTLSSVQEGATVTVGYAGGEQLEAEVVSTHLVEKTELSHDRTVWGSNSDTRRIVLITCDDALGSREDGHNVANFVVVAEVSQA